MDYSYAPIIFVAVLAILIPTIFVILSALLGPRKPGAQKLSPYESGILPQRFTGRRFQVKFYLVAVLFLLFDLEVVFLFPWAVRLRELGWVGMGAVSIFIFVLVLGLAYEWRKGAMEWR